MLIAVPNPDTERLPGSEAFELFVTVRQELLGLADDLDRKSPLTGERLVLARQLRVLAATVDLAMAYDALQDEDDERCAAAQRATRPSPRPVPAPGDASDKP
jgi:hypothetical protein